MARTAPTLFLGFLFIATSASALAPIVLAPTGEGRPLLPDSRGPVPQVNPAVASDGRGWFAVWEDSRYWNVDAFGTGVAASGAVVHPDGIPLAPTFTTDRDPQIVWTGDRYLAAFVNDLGIFTVRFTAEGGHLGSGLSIAASGALSYSPTFATGTWLAWNGDRALVAWHQAGGPDELRVALLDREGSLMTSPIPIAAAPRAISMSVAADGEGFLLAWETMDGATSTLQTVAIAREGTVGSTQTIATFPKRSFGGVIGFEPVVAVRGERRILLWSDGAIRGVRLGANGEPLESPFTIAGTEGGLWVPGNVVPIEQGWIATIAGGGLVADGYGSHQWNSDVSLLRLGGDGRPAAPPVPAVAEPGTRRNPSMAPNGEGRLFIAWDEGGVVRGRRVESETLAPLEPPGVLALGLTNQRAATLTPHGNDNKYLLSWYEDGGRLALVGPSGELQSPIRSFEGKPVVASTGAIALVAWTEQTIVEGRYVPRAVAIRLGEDGVPLDQEPFVLAEGSEVSSVATDGVDFMVALLERRYLPSIPYIPDDQLWTAAVSSTGRVGERTDVPRFQDGWYRQESSAIAWAGNHYLVVWNERHPCIAGHCVSDLYAIPVAASGIPLASEGTVVTMTPSRMDEVPLDLACGPAECALVLTQLGRRAIRLSPGGERLHGAITDPGIPLSTIGDPYQRWSIVWDGTRFVTGAGALAPLPSGAVLRVVERTLTPLPLAHAGTVTRLYVDSVENAGRHRMTSR